MISIVIPHFGDDRLLDRCLDALQRHTPLYELVVIDNNTRNRGFAAGCNEGFRNTSGHPVVFLNNDTEVHPGWSEPLQAAFQDPQVGAVGARLLYPNGQVQHGGVDIGIVDGTVTAWNVTDPQTAATRRQVPAVTGACMAVRPEAFTAVDGFDEGFWNGYEDVDLCLRLADAGWAVLYEPASLVTHLESQSGPQRWAGVRENVKRLHDRWIRKVSDG